MNSRLRIHFLFWGIYFLWVVYLQVITLSGLDPSYSFSGRIAETISIVFLFLLPKFFLAYFVLVFPLKRALVAKKITGSHLLQITGIFILGVLCYRAIAVYIVYPYVMKANVSEIIFLSQPGFVTAFLDIVVPVSLLSSFEFYRISMDGKVRESRLEREKLQSELSFLKAQTNPHFLFNTLSNIYGLTKNLAPKAADAVDRLSALLRFMLYESEQKTISIQDEMRFVEDYIELQRIRFDEKLIITIDTEIDNEQTKIAPLLLLPFVENAFKHGVSESLSDSYIRIRLNLANGDLFFVIENPVDTETGQFEPGIGLSNVKRRLDLLYPGHRLELIKEQYFFRVSMQLNLS